MESKMTKPVSVFDLRLALIAQRRRIAETLRPAIEKLDAEEAGFRAWLGRRTK